MRSFYIKTHGCQMNEYDSAKIADVLIDRCGFTKAESAEDATLLIVNTCSIRENARNKIFSGLGRWRKIKEENPDVIIAVAGCVSSQEGENVLKQATQVDIVFGPQTLHRLPEMLAAFDQTHKPQVDVSFPEIEKFDSLPEPRAEGATAFVSIMEGCNNFCTYCVVPYTRGREWSRPQQDILDEITALTKQGVKEVNLLGQNVNAYQGEDTNGDKSSIAQLIREVAKIDAIKRIRFTTSHPKWFGDELIQLFAEEPKLVNHLHLPVQSGSDNVLKMMKRKYTSAEYKEKVEKLKKVRPDICISSDFIVGFPGETEENFNETMELIKEVEFDQSFSFVYSPRPGTEAAKMEDDTELEVKKNRLSILQKQIARQAGRVSASMVGTEQEVLVHQESKQKNGQIAGRTENNRVVNFDGSPKLIGELVKVRITEALPNSLRGELV